MSKSRDVLLDTVLFELGTEELPPASLPSLWADLKRSAVQGLVDAGLIDSGPQLEKLPKFYAARRLALKIPEVRSETKPDTEIRRGPALKASFDKQDNPTKALMGFARSCGADEKQIESWRTGKDCLKTEKGVWVTFRLNKPARPVQNVLPEIMRQAVADISLDVRMRWGQGGEEFTRPVRWVVLLYGKEIVPGDLMGLEFGRESCGHRFLTSDPIAIDEADSYEDQLHENSVLVSQSKRDEVLAEGVKRKKDTLRGEYGESVGVAQHSEIRAYGGAAQEYYGSGPWYNPVWEKNLAAIEWPQPIVGRFDERFLLLPEKVVETVLEDQQQCLPVRKSRGGHLTPYFIAVAGLPDKAKRIRAGYERVVQARLQDAEFYLQRDQQRCLKDRVVDLERVVFHRKLGSLADRTRRIEALAGFIAKEIGVDEDIAKRAAYLCKADLGTDMVQAFPHLQGVMGAYYARANGEDELVCSAIETHYWHHPPPEQPSPLPSFSGPGWALIVADRLDLLVGIFAAGETPSGSRDPLGVRRAAYDLVYLTFFYGWSQDRNASPGKVFMESGDVDIDINKWIKQAAEGYPVSLDAVRAVGDVRNYIADRLRSDVALHGHARDETEAVLAVLWNSPQEVYWRRDAVRNFRGTQAGLALVEANKRIRNILRKSEAPDGDLDPELLREPAEQALAERVAALRPQVEKLCRERQYRQAMEQLATLAEPVAKFFDDVLVMAEEPEIRHNRLRLLRDVRELFLTIADLSRLQGAAKAA